MLKKLRRKFITIAMISVSIVLISIVGMINIANYINTNQAIDARLELIAENDGHFPDLSLKTPPQNEQEGNRPPESEDREPMEDDRLKRHGISPESQFDTRYFTVIINNDGDIEKINTGNIVMISSDTAAEYADNLWNAGISHGGKSGFRDSFKYVTVDKEDSTMYIFLDCQREISAIKMYVWASAGISLFGLIVVFIMIYFFSGKVLKPISESYEKQKRFITDASHEIKTPLTIIDANTEVIEMMEGENEWTKSTRKQVGRLVSLTEKLVFLSRMDEETTRLEMCEFSLSDAVLDIAEPFKAVAQAKNKHLEIDVPEGIMYTGDERIIRQLLSILIDNSMKYSGYPEVFDNKQLSSDNNSQMSDGKTIYDKDNGQISITLGMSGKARIIKVWNTVSMDANIKKGNQDIVFERFYRTDSSRNSKTGGFGIGLSAAAAIVKAHKGKIHAKSDDGNSIEFTVTL